MAGNLGRYHICIDDNYFIIRENSLVRQSLEHLPPRISTGGRLNFTDLTVWQQTGMNSFIGGMGQKRLKDEEMFFDSYGIDSGMDYEAKLARTASLWKSVADLGITLADMLNQSCSIYAATEFLGKIYFGVAEGDWGTGDFGKCRLYSYDGTTLTDLSSTLPATYVAVAAPSEAGPTDITVADTTGFAAGDWLLATTPNFAGWEMLYVNEVKAGNILNCNRAQNLEWDAGKTWPTTAMALAVNSMVYKTSYSSMIKAGGGVASLATYDNKLYVGTQHGFMFMFDGTNWRLSPHLPDLAPYSGHAVGDLHSTNLSMQTMCAWRDKLYAAQANNLLCYDSGTVSGGNPWGTGPLQRVKDAINLNNMMYYNYALYLTSWRDQGRAAALYKYDGSTLFPVYKFHPVSEIHSALVYDGKIFLGVGRYNAAGTYSVGQLWSFDGATMRKLMSKPRDDQWDTVGLQTIFKMGAYNDKLFFSDNNTTGL
ncbi:MAG: hypothetical protein ACYC3G_00570, partial [Minisyncoccota bacterium]